MLQRKPDGKPSQVRSYAFLIGVELEDGVITPEQAALKLADALSFCEGTGQVDVEPMGEIQIYPEGEE